ncbi:MAG TPA: outer membrane beta-barrel protein [Candidatus Aminicenantes bacterium]|nr:outer membrane beta-barrel protein [Candidatus Aminicenantes bacterium]HRY64867.1 outer membrane beta-barrel protein [Candidatus Aminicenantes bacterium]HRZ71780.1 outer membrane beta-barrel protein [Candidatus Aminicenantes bacterium]
MIATKSKTAFAAALLFLAAAVGGAGTALAQENTWSGESLALMVDQAQWKLGLLRVNAGFQLTNAGYDTDIYYGYGDGAEPDATLTAALPLQIILPISRKAVLDVTETPQYVFYLQTERERAWNNLLRARLHLALDRFYFRFEGGLDDIRRRLSPELNLNVRQKQSVVDGIALWQASRKTSFAFLYGLSRFEYGSSDLGLLDVAAVLDRDEQYLDALTFFQPTPRLRLHLDGQYGTYGFANPASRNRDARSYGLLGGFEFLPREGEAEDSRGVTGSVRLGFMRFDLRDAAMADESNFVGDALVSARLIRRTTLRLLLARSFQFSAFSGSTYYLSTRFGGGITRHFSRRASISYDVSVVRGSYPVTDPEPGLADDINYRYLLHDISLDFRLRRDLWLSLVGSLGRRTIGGEEVSRSRNFFGLNLFYGRRAGSVAVPVGGLSR